MMNMNDMVQELAQLQQQLLYLGNNPHGQAQVNARINEVQNAIRFAQQQQQQMAYQAQQPPMYPPPQPQMAYQAQQQPMAYQQQNQQQVPQPFNPMMAQQGDQAIDTSISKNSRFNKPNHNRINRHVVEQDKPKDNNNMSCYQQQEVAAQKPKKPMSGSEFPLLLANGLVTKIKDLGDYFEYEIVGNSDMKYSDDIFSISPDDETPVIAKRSKYTTMLYHCLKEHKQNVIYEPKTYFTTAEKIAFDADDFINQFTMVMSLEELAALLKSRANSLFVNILNKKLTKLVNTMLKYSAMVKTDIDNFKDDITELSRTFVPELQEVQLRKRFASALDKTMATIKTWDIKYEESDGVTIWELSQPKPTLYTIDKNYVEDLIDNTETEPIKVVTTDSHAGFYNLLYEAEKMLSETNEFYLSHFKQNGDVQEYVVNKTYTGLYTIRKELT